MKTHFPRSLVDISFDLTPAPRWHGLCGWVLQRWVEGKKKKKKIWFWCIFCVAAQKLLPVPPQPGTLLVQPSSKTVALLSCILIFISFLFYFFPPLSLLHRGKPTILQKMKSLVNCFSRCFVETQNSFCCNSSKLYAAVVSLFFLSYYVSLINVGSFE